MSGTLRGMISKVKKDLKEVEELSEITSALESSILTTIRVQQERLEQVKKESDNEQRKIENLADLLGYLEDYNNLGDP